MAEAKNLRSWKFFLINPRFQLTFVFSMALISLLMAGVFFAGLQLFFGRLRTQLEWLGYRQGHAFQRFVDIQERELTLTFLSAAAIATLLMLIGGIILSHRVAGPLYRLRTHCELIADGAALGPVKFRKGDYFQELAQAYNKHLDRLTGSR